MGLYCFDTVVLVRSDDLGDFAGAASWGLQTDKQTGS